MVKFLFRKPSVWRNPNEQPKSIDDQIKERLEPKQQHERDLGEILFVALALVGYFQRSGCMASLQF